MLMCVIFGPDGLSPAATMVTVYARSSIVSVYCVFEYGEHKIRIFFPHLDVQVTPGISIRSTRATMLTGYARSSSFYLLCLSMLRIFLSFPGCSS